MTFNRPLNPDPQSNLLSKHVYERQRGIDLPSPTTYL